MNKDTIINAVNKTMQGYGKASGNAYNVSEMKNLVSEMDTHKITYEVQLSGGRLNIDLIYTNRGFKVEYSHTYPNTFNPTDYQELWQSSAHFDRHINPAQLMPLFELLNEVRL